MQFRYGNSWSIRIIDGDISILIPWSLYNIYRATLLCRNHILALERVIPSGSPSRNHILPFSARVRCPVGMLHIPWRYSIGYMSYSSATYIDMATLDIAAALSPLVGIRN